MGDWDLDDWDSQEILYLAFGAFGGLIIFLSIFCACCNRRRHRKSVVSSQSIHSNHSNESVDNAPVVVTTATTQVPFTPGQNMQHTIIQSHQPYPPMGHQGYAMPMPAANQHSYPMPQAGYPTYPSGGAPYPPAGPHENMNPPSYDQVVGTTTTITNENYAKQAPYNPNYTG